MRENLSVRMRCAYALLAGFVLIMFYAYGGRSHDHIVQTCVLHYMETGDSSPCLKVDLVNHFVLFRDDSVTYRNILMPSSSKNWKDALMEGGALLMHAWETRHYLTAKSGMSPNDDFLSLVIDAKDEAALRIQVACMKPNVYDSLREDKYVGPTWQKLSTLLAGHHFVVKKIGGNLMIDDPIKMVDEYVDDRGDDIGQYSFAVVPTEDRSFLLLLNRSKVTETESGITEGLQDGDCALMKRL
jgi:CDP-diacylglycerol pyrophosphatase